MNMSKFVLLSSIVLLSISCSCSKEPVDVSPEPKATVFSNNPLVSLADCTDLLASNDRRKIISFLKHADNLIKMLGPVDTAVGTTTVAAGETVQPAPSDPLKACTQQLRRHLDSLSKKSAG